MGKIGCILTRLVVFEENGWAKLAAFGQNGSIWAKLILFIQHVLFRENDYIWDNCFYLEKMVLFGHNSLYLGKIVLSGHNWLL